VAGRGCGRAWQLLETKGRDLYLGKGRGQGRARAKASPLSEKDEGKDGRKKGKRLISKTQKNGEGNIHSKKGGKASRTEMA